MMSYSKRMDDWPTEEVIRETAILLFAADAVLVGDMPNREAALSWSIRIFESADTDPLWANGRHEGDCTNQPMTCTRCLCEEYIEEARKRWG
jgi:hypothetical protein